MQTSLKLNGGEADEEAKPTIPQTTGGTRRIFRKRSAAALASENTEQTCPELTTFRHVCEKCDRAINATSAINAKYSYSFDIRLDIRIHSRLSFVFRLCLNDTGHCAAGSFF